MQIFYLWIPTVLVLMFLDTLWFGTFGLNYYKSQLGPLLAPQVTWWAAGLLYVLYAAGIVFFVIQPSLDAHSFSRALWGGLFLGLVAFGVYDLTNVATTVGWPVTMSFVDMAWGAFQGAVVSGVVYWFATTFRF